MRNTIKDKKRIVFKVGSSSLTHKETGKLDLTKLERLVRKISDISSQGKDVVLVSSGAIAVGKSAMNLFQPKSLQEKQALAAIGQSKLIMVYQKLFAEYGQTAAQILITKNNMTDKVNRENAHNTFEELFILNAIPIVNENDTVTTDEIEFGDNDTLSALVAALVGADLLVLLSDIDGLYDDDPRVNPDATFIPFAYSLDDQMKAMAK
ncbi:MAG: glutamate 5-kinase, partial [Lachnospiraceae bacterium]|nr:glutamate 5-kinase [Candidatus Equihabitans merdae]